MDHAYSMHHVYPSLIDLTIFLIFVLTEHYISFEKMELQKDQNTD